MSTALATEATNGRAGPRGGAAHGGTRFPELWAALAAEFHPREVKTLPKGKGLLYITARTAMNRLDTVLGPENWWDEYPYISDNSAVCALTVRLPDGSTVTKHDAGGAAGMADAGDDDKSMLSDAFKRAAAKFGVARYLYRDGVPEYHFEPPPPLPANGTGHGAGAYAPPDQVKAFTAWVTKVCAAAETHYADRLTDEFGGNIPGKPAEKIMPTFRLARHLLKVASERKIIEVPPDDKLVSDQVNKLAAIWFARDKDAVLAETGSYVRRCVTAEIDRLTGADGDGDAPDSDDPAGDWEPGRE